MPYGSGYQHLLAGRGMFKLRMSYGSSSQTGVSNSGRLGAVLRYGACPRAWELTLKSTLNQPLVAEIELLDVKELTAAEVVPSLASPEDFAKAGVDRQAFLNDLTFTPVLSAGGKASCVSLPASRSPNPW